MAFKKLKNIWGNLRQLADRDLWNMADPGAPSNGTSGTGAGFAGIGALYTNITTGAVYVNTGTKASPTWSILATGSFDPGFGIVAAGTTTSGATTSVSVVVSGALATDIPIVTWRNVAQTTADIYAVATTDAITVTFATTVGTAGTIQYALVRAN